ncbi:MAG TPA: HlyD family efflux transporter periplasmic adaptor subunit [Acidobacteriota bacterium]|nr:HlyD family efflux transporter periplasmic adaptor subunit [Acidobacteriota bacterium]
MRQDGASMDKEVARKSGLVKWGFLLAALVVVGALAVYLYPSFSHWASADRSIDRTRLRFGEATQGDLLRDVSVQGKVVAAESPTVVSPAQGVISIIVKAGDVVGRGDILAHIKSPALENELQQEESTLLSMQSEVERLSIANQQANMQNLQEVALLEMKVKTSTRAMERARTLFEEGLGSSIDYEKAKDEVEVATLELAHSQRKAQLDKNTKDFELKTKRLDLDRQQLVIRDLERKVAELAVNSPVNGLVSRVDVMDKDTVQPNQKIFVVVDLSEFEVEILVPENYADEIGSSTGAAIQYEGEEYSGEVKSLSPEVESSQVKGIVIFTGDPPSGLKQNQRVFTRLILDLRSDVVKVPRGPFLESLGGRQAYKVEGNMARLVPIRVGTVSVTEVEIQSGLEPGDQVILTDLTRYEGAQTILLRD